MKIKIDIADTLFSQWIRLRDKECVRCHSRVEFNDEGLPVTHQASHYFSRAAESTRFYPENVDTLCYGCHQHWGSADKEGYREFKKKQLGVIGWKLLQFRHESYKKKDRKMERIIWRAALKKALQEKND